MEKEILTILTVMQKDMSFLKGTVAGIEEELTGLKGEVCGLNEQFTGLKGEVCGLNEQFTGLKGEVCGLNEQFSNLQGEVCWLQGEFAGFKGEFAGFKGEFSEFKGEVRDNFLKVNLKIENQVQKSISILSEGHTAIINQLNPLEKRVSATENDLVNLKIIHRLDC